MYSYCYNNFVPPSGLNQLFNQSKNLSVCQYACMYCTTTTSRSLLFKCFYCIAQQEEEQEEEEEQQQQ